MNASIRTSVSLLALAAAAGMAHAQCGYIFRTGVPDLDQRRGTSSGIYGLPNTGNMYCVPTSCIDNLAYMANHGYRNAVSTALPGPQTWTSSANYNFVGACIATMGNYLGTTPSGGTNNYTNGLLNYINTNLPNDYVQIFGDSFTPSSDLGNVAKDMHTAIDLGALVNLHIGWFERRGPSSARYWERTGGHVVALNGVDDACTASPILFWRDPWNDSSVYSQAGSSTSGSDISLRPDAYSWKDDPDKYFKFGWQINCYTGTTKGFVGGYKAIWPNFGLGIDDSSDATVLKFHMPKSINKSGAPETRTASISTFNGPVKFLDAHPSNTFSCVITDPIITGVNDKLLKINHGDGSVSQILSLDGVGGPLVFGNTGELYFCDGMTLKAINPHDGVVRQASGLARSLDSLVFDDAEQMIVGLDIATKRIDFYETQSLKIQSSRTLPTTVTLGADSCLAIDPSTGNVWLCPDQGGVFYELGFTSTSGIVTVSTKTLPGVASPRAFQMTSKGDIIVNDGGTLEELMPMGRTYTPANRTGLAGLKFAGEFRMPRTRETFDPATIDLYDNHDTLPDLSADCLADLNDDGLVDFSDYLEFLNFYDAEDSTVDFTGDGLIDFTDYLEFLNLYDAGC